VSLRALHSQKRNELTENIVPQSAVREDESDALSRPAVPAQILFSSEQRKQFRGEATGTDNDVFHVDWNVSKRAKFIRGQHTHLLRRNN
jgi:hypothetical protein